MRSPRTLPGLLFSDIDEGVDTHTQFYPGAGAGRPAANAPFGPSGTQGCGPLGLPMGTGRTGASRSLITRATAKTRSGAQLDKLDDGVS